MTIALLSLIFTGIIAIEAPGLVKNKMWRELAAFFCLLVIGMIYSYGQALDLPLPNPTKAIMAIFEPVSKFIEKLLT